MRVSLEEEQDLLTRAAGAQHIYPEAESYPQLMTAAARN
jgi:hypothetical protein